MSYVLFWLILCVVTAIIASSKNRSGVLWFFISLLFSPLIGIICVACMPAIVTNDPKKQFKLDNTLVNMALYRECPECAEEIKYAAKKCKHCGSKVIALDAEENEQRETLVNNSDGTHPCSICKIINTNDLYNGVPICNRRCFSR